MTYEADTPVFMPPWGQEDAHQPTMTAPWGQDSPESFFYGQTGLLSVIGTP
jgi:hypothetical protein